MLAAMFSGNTLHSNMLCEKTMARALPNEIQTVCGQFLLDRSALLQDSKFYFQIIVVRTHRCNSAFVVLRVLLARRSPVLYIAESLLVGRSSQMDQGTPIFEE